MVDISVEILASSVELRSGHKSRYRIKTWWAHIDVPPNTTLIELPRLPMIQQYLVMTGKDTTLFVETWREEHGGAAGGNEGPFASNNKRFIGMATCSVDEQLKNQNLNPTVQWLDVHDPIEDVNRGKLLLKVFAKFALTTDTNEKVFEPGSDVISKGLHGPPPAQPHNSLEQIYSPANQIIISPQVSRRSYHSLASSTSVTSCRSQEQGIQTDFSLPVLPDISKYSRALKSQDVNNDGFIAPSTQPGKRFYRQNSRSLSNGSSVFIDPLQYAENILLQHSSALEKCRRSSEPVTGKPPISLPSTSSKRNYLVRQNQQQSSVVEESSASNRFEFENIEDIIDVLNEGHLADSVFSPLDGLPTFNSKDLGQPPHPNPKASNGDAACRMSKGSTRCNEANNILRNEEVGRRKSGPRSIPNSNTNDSNKVGWESGDRFKEVHYDGTFQLGADRLKSGNNNNNNTRKSSQSNRPSGSGTHPPVMKRRIAAAIFPDD